MIVTVLDFVKGYLPTAEIDTMIVTVLEIFWNEWLQISYQFELKWLRREEKKN